MIFGMSIETFTIVHTVISLIGIASGLVAVIGMLGNKRLEGWTAVFLVTTVLTSLTGFTFPFTKLLPSHLFGIISLAILVPVILARYTFNFGGAWRWIYVTGALFTLYLNAFVGVVQSFQKIAGLKTLAPTQAEPPFAIAQGVLLIVFLVLGYLAVRKFHPLSVL